VPRSDNKQALQWPLQRDRNTVTKDDLVKSCGTRNVVSNSKF